MTQVSDIGQQEGWVWACPYCRAPLASGSTQCSHCGSPLQDPDGDDLFTTVAADYAEVIPPDPPFARDNMWTTDANDPDPYEVEDAVGESELVDDVGEDAAGAGPDDVWDVPPFPGAEPGRAAAGFPGAGVGSPGFSAEPNRRPADVIEEPFSLLDDVVEPVHHSGTLFSGRTNGRAAADSTPSDRVGPFAAPAASSAGPHTGAGATGPQLPPPFPDPTPWSVPGGTAPPPPPVPDAHGLAAAISRLRPEAAEAAEVPISVCGALLVRDEVVLAAVTGQMLGHAAVVVLTNQRVMVVNGRRWQPIVDVFALGPDLVVRGRHDRDVASLTFSDATQLSTVDAIGEVALAVELAERIRGN
ncbi:MAG TPA: zinc ribbon domain-containing protein [Microthrixaceae bacterium]|nr:zinc ribbon domain-containing protein [Microthrixaceae bacterium]MCB9374279.1 zinc ribbon domain-containing protein [Microthrixaceae bacterium]MCB9400014.1 zinc ribbon domain-containing protein [Microthrixaceae bacterium]MCO5306948.1 zinc ribbon domain-containing protein [Microthrixaceae bacterium]HNB95811.1 zinc ribbon domain-containing protein [Microthrixaceae bacterium]